MESYNESYTRITPGGDKVILTMIQWFHDNVLFVASTLPVLGWTFKVVSIANHEFETEILSELEHN